MTDELVTRDATEQDRDAVVSLLTAAHGLSVRDAQAWDWLFRGRLGRYVVADAGDRLAAQYALLPVRVRHRGAVIDASLSLDTATHPDFGGRGLMTDLGLLAYERSGSDLVFGFPNPKSAWILYNRLGWTELAPFPLLVKPLAGIVRAVTGTRIRLPRRKSTLPVEQFDRFGSWADHIWDANAERLGTSVVRDSDHLNWRFADAPHTYERFVSYAGTDPAAYAVLRTVPWRRGRVSYVMELAGLPGAESEAADALGAAVAAARDAGSAGVAAVATHRDPLLGTLRNAGFRPAPARVRVGFSFGNRTIGGLSEHTDLKHLDNWYVTAGDFDHI
ncbi:MAG TPA: GNAT family N-acetyltransferase [Microbacteriaceae bacterium]|jgi:hypothetical protein|nr:GNAT family N-acetyltransferase [Microbacteriaceae bacterium]